MVSVTQAFAVDLTGQICADQFEGEFYSGVSTQPDFMRGAARSPGGKPIICLASTTDDGKTSRIRPLLEMGEGVAIARSDAHYVVTEYGIAYLFGKSIRERTLALIEIAHPDFRPWLLDEAKRLGYVPPEQRIGSQLGYQIEEERQVRLKDRRNVLIRPARATDAAAIQRLIHEMSEGDVYSRFFRRLRALSYAEAQAMCSINYETEVAFVATTGSREQERVVAIAAYYLDASVNLAETAYTIAHDWQQNGLGQALQQRMSEYARARGVRGFTAEVMVHNLPMVSMARRCCNSVTMERRDDVYHITMCFD
jgi:N-acetylglutamate synthase-like GNAT family acetyltransferase